MAREIRPLRAMAVEKIAQDPGAAVSAASLQRSAAILPPAASGPARQQLLDALLDAGELREDTLPVEFWDRQAFTSLSLSGSRLSAAFLSGVVAARCPSLTRLSLSGCFQLSDAGLEAVLGGCPGLTSLDLSNCRKLSDAALELLPGSAPALQGLHLGGCSNLSLPGIQALLQAHPRTAALTSLDLSGHLCPPELLGLVAQLCGPQLQLLGVGYSHATDEALASLVGRFPGLTGLRLHWCVQLTDASLALLLSACEALESLDIRGVRGLSSEGIRRFVDTKCSAAVVRFRSLRARFTQLTKEQAAELRARHPQLELEG